MRTMALISTHSNMESFKDRPEKNPGGSLSPRQYCERISFVRLGWGTKHTVRMLELGKNTNNPDIVELHFTGKEINCPREQMFWETRTEALSQILLLLLTAVSPMPHAVLGT
jgi:hypothetical protein